MHLNSTSFPAASAKVPHLLNHFKLDEAIMAEEQAYDLQPPEHRAILSNKIYIQNL